MNRPDLDNCPLIPPDQWFLNMDVTHLNHGSFGACPKDILKTQQELRIRMESELVDFLIRDLESLLDENRLALADFVGTTPEKLVFCQNATAGVNAIVRSLKFNQGGNFVIHSHAYNACANALEFVADRENIEVRVFDPPFAFLHTEDQVADLEQSLDSGTQLVMLDHITSPTAQIFPLEEMIRLIRSRAPEAVILIDGAHAPGQILLNLDALDIDFYTGNLHKWLFTPKTSAFLYASKRNKDLRIHPTIISHGANSKRTDRPASHLEFDWQGTSDPTPHLCIKSAIEWVKEKIPGGWQELRDYNHQLVLYGRGLVSEVLESGDVFPESSIGSMVAFELPPPMSGLGQSSSSPPLPLVSEWLRKRHRIEASIHGIRNTNREFLRITAQAYNTPDDYLKLESALREGQSSGWPCNT